MDLAKIMRAGLRECDVSVKVIERCSSYKIPATNLSEARADAHAYAADGKGV